MMTNRAHSLHFSFLKPLSLELGHQKDGSLPGTNQEQKGPHHRLESGTGQVVDAVQGRNHEKIQAGFLYAGLEGFQSPSIFVVGDSQHTELTPLSFESAE